MTGHTAGSTHPAWRRFADAIDRVGAWVERHPVLPITLILVGYVFTTLRQSLNAPLWHDELFTLWIAQAPTLREMVRQTRLIDLNPPLSYLLTRISLHVFGEGTLQTRLPEMIGMMGALVGIYLFVRRRAGTAFAFLGAAMFWCTEMAQLGNQARPYGLVLGFSSLALATWQASLLEVKPARSRGYDLLLFALLSLLLLSHVFGLLTWGAIACGEAVQTLRARRLNVLRAAAILLALGWAWLYKPLLTGHAANVYPPLFQPHFRSLVGFFKGEFDIASASLMLTLIFLAAIGGRRFVQAREKPLLSPAEWTAVLGCIAMPVLLVLYLMKTHASFFPRYASLTAIGVALLFAFGMFLMTNGAGGAAVVATLVALVLTGRLPSALAGVAHAPHYLHSNEPTVGNAHFNQITNPALPLVVASGLTYVAMNRYEKPDVLQRTWYLTGGPFAVQYAHAGIFEQMALEKRIFHFRSNVDSYTPFVAAHPHFYVVGTYDYAEDWLLRKLDADGATLIRRAGFDAFYKDKDIWEVYMPGASPTGLK